MSMKYLVGLCLWCVLFSAAYGYQDKDKVTLGWMEAVTLSEWDVPVKAKLDTGAKTCSIDAHDIERFQRDGKIWVRFSLVIPAGKASRDVNIRVERPLVREASIKVHGADNQSRAVVTLPIRLGGKTYEPEFTLADRARYLNPMLLGRDFLRQIAFVDPDHRFRLGLPKGIDKYAKRRSGQSAGKK